MRLISREIERLREEAYAEAIALSNALSEALVKLRDAGKVGVFPLDRAANECVQIIHSRVFADRTGNEIPQPSKTFASLCVMKVATPEEMAEWKQSRVRPKNRKTHP